MKNRRLWKTWSCRQTPTGKVNRFSKKAGHKTCPACYQTRKQKEGKE